MRQHIPLIAVILVLLVVPEFCSRQTPTGWIPAVDTVTVTRTVAQTDTIHIRDTIHVTVTREKVRWVQVNDSTRHNRYCDSVVDIDVWGGRVDSLRYEVRKDSQIIHHRDTTIITRKERIPQIGEGNRLDAVAVLGVYPAVGLSWSTRKRWSMGVVYHPLGGGASIILSRRLWSEK